MLIEVKDFPSDPNCVLGNLRTQLVYALHTSSQSKITSDLLGKTLTTASKLLKAVKRGTVKRDKLLAKRAEDKRIKEIDLMSKDAKEIARMEKEVQIRALRKLEQRTAK